MSIKEKAAAKAREVETMINDGKENVVKKSSVLKKVVIGAEIAGGAFGIYKLVDHFRGLHSNDDDVEDDNSNDDDDDCEVDVEDDDVEDDNSNDEE